MTILASNRIRDLREAEGLTLTQLGAKVGVEARTIDRWENGKNEPRPEQRMRLANVFGHSIVYVMGWDSEPDPNASAKARGKTAREAA